MTTTLICDCNQTMPLDPKAIGTALAKTPEGKALPLHSTLCRRDAPAFQQAIRSGDEVVVACTQEHRLFSSLANQTEGATSPLRFVNIRETGGWGREAAQASPKIAALLAMAALPEPEPVATVGYASSGRLLIVGALEAAEQAAALLADALEVSIFATGAGATGGAQERRWPVSAGSAPALTGWLGAFGFAWRANNPIDLDLCTRCNACIEVCPEGAIGLDYQIDLARCTGHRDCVKVCKAAGAIDFARVDRTDRGQTAAFDLVLDLSDTPLIDWHAQPQGYVSLPGGLASDAVSLAAVLRLRDLVGEFDKPKFFDYQQKICAHSRNETIGCRACIDVCSAHAISSDTKRQRIVVNPNLCIGCGACSTVCPTGAMAFTYPRAPDQGRKLRTLLGTYERAGGKDAVLLLHSEEGGQALIDTLGRLAQLGRAKGLPARVIPLPLWHPASTGIDLWLAAVAFGAAQVNVLLTEDVAPTYRQALREQMAVAQAILTGLGYAGKHFTLVEAEAATALDEALARLSAQRTQSPLRSGRFAVSAEKRTALEMALEHLIDAAPARIDTATVDTRAEYDIALPAGAPLGGIVVDRDACTLCLACVSACPANALRDNADAPQLSLVEKNCVQCGLCATTCPEDAITLVPRLRMSPERKQPVVLNRADPWVCIRCSKAFGTAKAIESMLGRLAGHSMFQGDALERLKMCSDCRVIDLFAAQEQARITDR